MGVDDFSGFELASPNLVVLDAGYTGIGVTAVVLSLNKLALAPGQHGGAIHMAARYYGGREYERSSLDAFRGASTSRRIGGLGIGAQRCAEHSVWLAGVNRLYPLRSSQQPVLL